MRHQATNTVNGAPYSAFTASEIAKIRAHGLDRDLKVVAENIRNLFENFRVEYETKSGQKLVAPRSDEELKLVAQILGQIDTDALRARGIEVPMSPGDAHRFQDLNWLSAEARKIAMGAHAYTPELAAATPWVNSGQQTAGNAGTGPQPTSQGGNSTRQQPGGGTKPGPAAPHTQQGGLSSNPASAPGPTVTQAGNAGPHGSPSMLSDIFSWVRRIAEPVIAFTVSALAATTSVLLFATSSPLWGTAAALVAASVIYARSMKRAETNRSKFNCSIFSGITALDGANNSQDLLSALGEIRDSIDQNRSWMQRIYRVASPPNVRNLFGLLVSGKEEFSPNALLKKIDALITEIEDLMQIAANVSAGKAPPNHSDQMFKQRMAIAQAEIEQMSASVEKYADNQQHRMTWGPQIVAWTAGQSIYIIPMVGVGMAIGAPWAMWGMGIAVGLTLLSFNGEAVAKYLFRSADENKTLRDRSDRVIADTYEVGKDDGKAKAWAIRQLQKLARFVYHTTGRTGHDHMEAGG